MSMTNLLRRAWDALDTFKQAYPENWHEEDQQVLDDLIRADLRLCGVEVKWVGLTDEDIYSIIESNVPPKLTSLFEMAEWVAKVVEAKLREKNT